MRKTTLFSIVAAAVLGSAVAVAAPMGQDGGFGGGPGGPGGPHHGPHGGHGFGGGLDLHGLDLTDAQKASIKQIHQQTFGQLKTQFEAVRSARQAFEALAPNASGYAAAASTLAQAEAAATTARVTAEATANTQIYAVLTSAQQSQLATRKANFEARKAEWQQFKASHPVSSTSTSTAQ